MTRREMIKCGVGAALVGGMRAFALPTRSAVAARHLVYSGAKLPYDAEVEYLESTGTQWIDTGLYANLETVATLRARLEVPQSGHWLFGSRIAYNNRTFGVYDGVDQGYKFTIGFDNLGVSAGLVSNVASNDGQWHDITLGRTTKIDAWEKYYGDAGAFTTPTTLLLFAGNLNGTITTGEWRVSSLDILQNGDLVLSFIPVRFTNELGQSEGAMYDRVSGALFRNAGTGAFTIGPNKN